MCQHAIPYTPFLSFLSLHFSAMRLKVDSRVPGIRGTPFLTKLSAKA